MTRERAEEMVNDLIAAVRDAEIYNRRDYHKHEAEMREKVIYALQQVPHSVEIT